MTDGFSCILDFLKFSGGGPPDPPYKGNTSTKPSNLSSTTTAKGKEKESESPPPLKQSTRILSLDYTEIEKRRRELGQDLFLCDLLLDCLKLRFVL